LRRQLCSFLTHFRTALSDKGEAQRRCVRTSASGNSLQRSCRNTLELGSNEDLAGFLRKKLTFDFCRSPIPTGELYVTTSLLNVKPEPNPPVPYSNSRASAVKPHFRTVIIPELSTKRIREDLTFEHCTNAESRRDPVTSLTCAAAFSTCFELVATLRKRLTFALRSASAKRQSVTTSLLNIITKAESHRPPLCISELCSRFGFDVTRFV